MKVALVGAGGIGSYAVDIIADEEIKSSQMPDMHLTVFDDDLVERRNVLYQNFDEFHADGMMYKVDALVEQGYAIDEVVRERVNTMDQLADFDVVMIAVDNVAFRRMVFKAQDKVPYWIDLRAEGRESICINKDSKMTVDQLLEITQESLKPENNTRGCAIEADLQAGLLQLGNRMAALFGAQALMNHYRGVKKPLKLRCSF